MFDHYCYTNRILDVAHKSQERNGADADRYIFNTGPQLIATSLKRYALFR